MTMNSTRPVPSTPNRGPGQIGMVAAVSIGIGGMVGAGIFSILGVVAQAAGNAMWLAFAIGGAVWMYLRRNPHAASCSII